MNEANYGVTIIIYPVLNVYALRPGLCLLPDLLTKTALYLFLKNIAVKCSFQVVYLRYTRWMTYLCTLNPGRSFNRLQG